MNKVAKIFSYIAFVFAFCCVAIGYAAVQDTLLVSGSVSVKANDKIYAVAEDVEGHYKLTFLKGQRPQAGTVYEVSTEGYTSENPPPWSSLDNLYEVAVQGEFKAPQSMAYWFYGCTQLEKIDLSGLDTSEVTNFSGMFAGCSALQKILVDRNVTVNSNAPANNMFYNCITLKGGAGTAYNASNTDETYACIDGGTSAPGYFTYVNYVLIFDGNSGAASNIPPIKLWDEANINLKDDLTDVNDPLHRWATFAGWEIASVSSEDVQYDVEYNPQTGACVINTPAPCTIKIQAVWSGLGATNMTELNNDLENGAGTSPDNPLIIGGGTWDTLTPGGGSYFEIHDGTFNYYWIIHNATFVIDGGTFNATTMWTSYGTYHIYEGTFTTTSVPFYTDSGGTQPTVYIYGGTFAFTPINSNVTADFMIFGGTFGGKPADDCVAEGHTAKENSDGTWTVVCDKNQPSTAPCDCACVCTTACSAGQINTNCLVCQVYHEKCKHPAQPEP